MRVGYLTVSKAKGAEVLKECCEGASGEWEQSCGNFVGTLCLGTLRRPCGNLVLGNLGGTLWGKVVGTLWEPWSKAVGTFGQPWSKAVATLEQSCGNVVEQSCGNLVLGNLGGTLWVKVVGALWNKVVGTQSCGNLGNLGGTLWGKVAQQTGRCLVVAWLRGFVFFSGVWID